MIPEATKPLLFMRRVREQVTKTVSAQEIRLAYRPPSTSATISDYQKMFFPLLGFCIHIKSDHIVQK